MEGLAAEVNENAIVPCAVCRSLVIQTRFLAACDVTLGANSRNASSEQREIEYIDLKSLAYPSISSKSILLMTKMKFPLFALLLAILAVCALGATDQRSVIVSYPNETPDEILDEAKAAVIKGGGLITHEYSMPIPPMCSECRI